MKLFNIMLFVVLTLAIFGYILPMLISAKSTELVLIGGATIFVYVLIVGNYIIKRVKKGTI